MDINELLETDGSLYKTYFSDLGVSFTYRLLSLKEYKIFRSLRDSGLLHPYILSDLVFERCYLGDPRLVSNDILAGVTISIGDLILWLSGDCESETLREDLIRARESHRPDALFEHMRATISAAFPSFTPDVIESWDRNKFLRNFILAENILLKYKEGYEPLNPKDIKTAGEMVKSNTPDINFRRENAELQKAVGYWGLEEAQDRIEEEQGKRKLTQKQLKALSKRRK